MCFVDGFARVIISSFNKNWHYFSSCQYLFEMVAIWLATMKTVIQYIFTQLHALIMSAQNIQLCKYKTEAT